LAWGLTGGVITKFTVTLWFVVELVEEPVEPVVVVVPAPVVLVPVVDAVEVDELLRVMVPEQSGFTE
jgi:hypothetical protein